MRTASAVVRRSAKGLDAYQVSSRPCATPANGPFAQAMSIRALQPASAVVPSAVTLTSCAFGRFETAESLPMCQPQSSYFVPRRSATSSAAGDETLDVLDAESSRPRFDSAIEHVARPDTSRRTHRIRALRGTVGGTTGPSQMGRSRLDLGTPDAPARSDRSIPGACVWPNVERAGPRCSLSGTLGASPRLAVDLLVPYLAHWKRAYGSRRCRHAPIRPRLHLLAS